jgi:hypothetical protein
MTAEKSAFIHFRARDLVDAIWDNDDLLLQAVVEADPEMTIREAVERLAYQLAEQEENA